MLSDIAYAAFLNKKIGKDNLIMIKVKISFFEFFAKIYEYLHFSKSAKTLNCLKELRLLNSEAIVLDLAGGTGRIAKQIKNQVKEITVVDASKKMLAECEKKKIQCRYGLAESIPFPDGYFDAVIIIDAFHHFQDQSTALKEISRVLKCGGKIFIEEVEKHSSFGFLLGAAEKLLLMNSHFYPKEKLLQTVKGHFKNQEAIKLNKSFFVVVCEK